MTQRHKTFSTNAGEAEPVTFTIDGVDTSKKKWSETFEAIPAMPGARLLDFIAEADSNDGGRAAQAIVNFLESCVVESDRERFVELTRDEERVIEIETLANVCEWLVGEYAVRPTTPSAPPSAGRTRSGRGSTAKASSRA